MVPTFKPGQVLYVRPEGRTVQPGDVVVYRKGDGYIVHRVHSVHPEGIYTRGDNNPNPDGYLIPPEQIIGIVDQVDDWGEIRRVRGGKSGFGRLKSAGSCIPCSAGFCPGWEPPTAGLSAAAG